jgi:hypothetical protein
MTLLERQHFGDTFLHFVTVSQHYFSVYPHFLTVSRSSSAVYSDYRFKDFEDRGEVKNVRERERSLSYL